MRKPFLFGLLITAILAGCSKPVIQEEPRTPVMVAVETGAPMPDPLSAPDSGGINRGYMADPLAYLQEHPETVAVIRGGVPDGLVGFPFSSQETVLMQHFLEYPLNLDHQTARSALAKAEAPGTAVPGDLAKGRLTDLKPGWKPIAVDGVLPTAESIMKGTYPLIDRVSVVYRPDAGARVRAVADQLKALTQPQGDPWVRLTITGDFMLARGVARAMRENGTLYPVAKVKDHLAAADLTFVNLESPIGETGRPLPGKQIWFRAAPEAVNILTAAGVDAVTLANNHILDYDTENFLETLSILERANVKYNGGGRNAAEARQPLILEAKGIKFAFLGYSEFADLFFDYGYPRSFTATDELPGVNRLDERQLVSDIAAARQKADVVVVAPHWGVEFQNYPTEEQRRLARLMIDSGADLVVGSHPHAIQGFEIYKEKLIAYSLGNFIMDRQDTDLARESMILDVDVHLGKVKAISVHPVWIAAEQPYIMTGREGESLLKKMQVISGWK